MPSPREAAIFRSFLAAIVVGFTGNLIAFAGSTGGTAAASSSGGGTSFVFNGFKKSHLELNGVAEIESNGLLRLSNNSDQVIGHAFYPFSLAFLNSSGKPISFSTSFVFAIVPQYQGVSSDGIAFVITPTAELSAALPSQHLGIFNLTHNGNEDNHIVAVELDTIQNKEFNDINNNHVGIDVNSLISLAQAPASYAVGGSLIQNLSLISGKSMRIWADYDAESLQFNVTLAPVDVPKPDSPLLSSEVNLSTVFLKEMHVGFSCSTGSAAGSHYLLGWSFSTKGKAEELSLLNLPSLPGTHGSRKSRKIGIILLLIAIIFVVLNAVVAIFIFIVKRKRRLAEVAEDWETEHGTRRFSYRDLYRSTGGFGEENLLGNGGFGEVYGGKLPKSKQAIAVKRISHDSKQGMKEFVAEIATIGRLRHRNLVQLLGYCRRRERLLLIYDFMPNGSLDKYIFGRPEVRLGWIQRFKIIKGIAAALVYLHEGFEQVVLHRDIKASNVMLDADFNGKLGDFGLARLHDHGSSVQTTRVVGTLGYLAPELSRTGKATVSSDVFAFGAFLLEVTCGKRPVELRTTGIEMVLVDWVLEMMTRGELVAAADRRMAGDFPAEEVEMVLMLGLMCSQPEPEARPSMRQVVQYLEGERSLSEMIMDDRSGFGHDSTTQKKVMVDVSLSKSDRLQHLFLSPKIISAVISEEEDDAGPA
ncbi:L-type lectin-domain containing receptor kinase IV.2 [Apostasia shenzhenica]|uniref:non-specific serine/threonine protein kinase n=1 Tax=Apostasia shenzhenica TaxID=1088818 RepID=A0A2I0ALH4_9ASPA|nr:L-type lectin-domain containing receptor kinase IV.2 [Apostasia shenzhenica]